MGSPLRIAFITADWTPGLTPPLPGGAGYARCSLPALALREAGHEVVVGCGVGVTRAGLMVPLDYQDKPMMEAPQIVVLQRWMRREAAQIIREARRQGQVVVNDVDDAYDALHHTNAAHGATDPQSNDEVNREHYRAALRVSNLITVSTPWLKKAMSRLGPRTLLLRNMVDQSAYPQPGLVRAERDGLRIGWTGGLAWRSEDLEQLRPWFNDWLQETGSTFHHLGVAMGHDWRLASKMAGVGPGARGDCAPMVTIAEYPDQVAAQCWDIGIVPLNDVPFNMAKSAIKGMEYATLGIPYVAAATPEYLWFGAGLMGHMTQWVPLLNRLLDPEERLRVRAMGLQRVRHEDVRVRWVEWDRAYHSLRSAQ